MALVPLTLSHVVGASFDEQLKMAQHFAQNQQISTARRAYRHILRSLLEQFGDYGAHDAFHRAPIWLKITECYIKMSSCDDGAYYMEHAAECLSAMETRIENIAAERGFKAALYLKASQLCFEVDTVNKKHAWVELKQSPFNLGIHYHIRAYLCLNPVVKYKLH